MLCLLSLTTGSPSSPVRHSLCRRIRSDAPLDFEGVFNFPAVPGYALSSSNDTQPGEGARCYPRLELAAAVLLCCRIFARKLAAFASSRGETELHRLLASPQVCLLGAGDQSSSKRHSDGVPHPRSSRCWLHHWSAWLAEKSDIPSPTKVIVNPQGNNPEGADYECNAKSHHHYLSH